MTNEKGGKTMSRTVYCVYACDEWKSAQSMRLLTICTSLSKLRQVLSAGIKAEFFEYADGNKGTFAQQAKRFRQHWRSEVSDALKRGSGTQDFIPPTAISAVKYAYIETRELNENPFSTISNIN